MKKTDPNIPIDPKDIQSAEDIDALKARMIDMQMEIDILKEMNMQTLGKRSCMIMI